MKKREYLYFVYYQWEAETKRGAGNCTFPTDRKIKIWADIDVLNVSATSFAQKIENDKTIKAIVMYYKLMGSRRVKK